MEKSKMDVGRDTLWSSQGEFIPCVVVDYFILCLTELKVLTLGIQQALLIGTGGSCVLLKLVKEEFA